ncbi:hypothetical protein B0H66DRAFT_589991 [Apodospora peruviana]|uniref:EH domain-containing protein n=1 Tax=Apodospora peruviana TaxID=516989 RepID=A0AAE0M7X3_9PEZI|nr:hypothetical protein B0H66DRAFT_589991 [Apodospora peruviana]
MTLGPSFDTPSRAAVTSASSTLATPGNPALAAALKGATLAFQAGSGQKTIDDHKPDSTARGPSWARSQPPSDNGALRAAAQAARDHSGSSPRSPTSRQGVSRHGTDGSAQELGIYNRDRERDRGRDRELDHGTFVHQVSQQLSSPLSAGSSPLLHPNARAGTDGKHASFIAATLAASRSASPSPNHTGQKFAQSPFTPTQKHSRVTRRRSSSANSLLTLSPAGQDLHPTDTSSIPPANSLISLFESKKDDMDPVKRRGPAPLQRPGPYPKIQPPTPPRSRSPDLEPRSEVQPAAVSKKPKPATLVENPPASLSQKISPDEVEGPMVPPRVSQPRRKTCTEDNATTSAESQPVEKLKPSPPPKSISKPVLPAAERRTTKITIPTKLPATEVVSPQPKRVVKTPQLEAPILPLRRSSTVKLTVSSARSPPATSHNIESKRSHREPHPESEDRAMRRLSQLSDSSDDSFVSASSTQSPRAASPVKDLEYFNANDGSSRNSPTPRPPSLPAWSPSSLGGPSPSLQTVLRRPTAPNASSPNLALDSLTNAIVAGNLASARLANRSGASSPGCPPPLPAPRRHGVSPLHALQPQRTADSLHSNYLHYHNGGRKSPSRQHQNQHEQRTGMLQTLRAPHTSVSDDEEARRHNHRHRKKALGGIKKHAHQEGSRRRWRDEISARERRRYEAVWASNRGLFLKPGFAFQHADNWRSSPSPSPAVASGTDQKKSSITQVDLSRAWDGPEAEYVVNVVVRDIWSRSRLPPDELAEVWDLVDRRKQGVLGKEEFVVGMWLIDQRLRGRKIPARVSESVSASARGNGMKVPLPPVAAREKERHGHGEKRGVRKGKSIH